MHNVWFVIFEKFAMFNPNVHETANLTHCNTNNGKEENAFSINIYYINKIQCSK